MDDASGKQTDEGEVTQRRRKIRVRDGEIARGYWRETGS